MKFNEKVRLKTKLNTLILLLIITLSITAIANIKANLPEVGQNDADLNTSSPIEPIYRYNYENDFNYYWHAAIIGGSFPVKYVEGYFTEWSQNSFDWNTLKLNFGCAFRGSLTMLGQLYVVSQNEFQKTSNPDLGAYIDWKMALGVKSAFAALIDSLDLSLLISFPTGGFETVYYHPSRTDLSPQQGQLYLPDFDRFIWDDGKIRFLLTATITGVTPALGGELVMTLSFEGLRIVQELIPHKPEAEERTLFYVHGWSITGVPSPYEFWDMFREDHRFDEFYGTNFHIISYYGNFMGEWVDTHTSIAHIAYLLALYIISNYASISDNVDFITHSMGGLVVRWMIKFFYADIKKFYLEELGRNINIRNVCTVAAPNHGVWYGWAGALLLNEQGKELQAGGLFMLILNFPPETPYLGYINWFTYAGAKFYITDGIVEIISVPLIGAINRGLYPFDHEQMITEYGVHVVVFNDLYRFPFLIQSIFNLNIPGKIVRINEFIIEPDPDTPEGEALFSITFPMEDVISIYPSTLRLYIYENTYEMTLKEGTIDTFEVYLPLAEDWYPFGISALEKDGGLYRMWGSFKIIDDDIQPPDIQITPDDLSFSDEEAVGGVLVSWEISDYSGISEAKVMLNGEVIRNYADEESISDEHLLPNILGVYTFSIWARDNDDDFEHAPSEDDRSEDTVERTYTIYDDDTNAPEIQMIPGDITISDGDAIGGVPVSWTISDDSGISEAKVMLNGEVIHTYGQSEGPINDLYLLANEPGIYTFTVWAKDNDNDLRHDPLEKDWEEYSVERTITIYDDDINAPELQMIPGDITISDGDAIGGVPVSWTISDDSGISEANVVLNGTEIRSYIDEGFISDSYLLVNRPGVYTFSIWAKDNDFDLNDDWSASSIERTITIDDDDTTEPIIGYDIIDRYWVDDQICLHFIITATDVESGIGLVDINIGSYSANFLGEHFAILDPGHYDLLISVSNGDTDRPNDIETAALTDPIDLMPLVTTISFDPPYFPINDKHHITSETEIIFSVDVVSELDSTWYKISNDAYFGEWTPYSAPLYLNIDDGIYTLEYYSVDTEGNTEKTKSVSIVLDNSAPFIDIIIPQPGIALQDGVTFTMEVTDLTSVEWVSISIREPGGPNGIIIDPAFEDLLATNAGADIWFYDFDTVLLPDGFYVIFVETCDLFSNYGCKTVEFGIRNWAVLELLPSTERNRAGRTMPVKFSLRVLGAVDPAMPFVWNEELDILIYDKSNPSIILQHSTFGDTSLDYRISAENELYITNFKTLKNPATYVVEIWRKGMPIGSFEFETYSSKKKINSASIVVKDPQIVQGLNLISLLGIASLLVISSKKLLFN